MMKAHRVRPWLLSCLLLCALLAGCSANRPTVSTRSTRSAGTPASATPTVTPTPTPKPTTLYLAADRTVYAFDATTGVKRWTYTIAPASSGYPNWVQAITATSSVVYIRSATDDNWLYALNASDGSLLWKASIFNNAADRIFVTPSAIIVASFFHETQTGVTAVDPQSGNTLWTQSDIGPNALLIDSGVIYESYDAFGPRYGKGGMVRAVNVTTGAVVWQATGPSYFDLALTNNLLYASGSDALHAFDARTGKEVWSQSFNDGIGGSPMPGSNSEYYVHVMQDGSTLYLINGSGFVYALNGATHSVMWQANAFPTLPSTSGVFCAISPKGTEGLDSATGFVKWQDPAVHVEYVAADGGICYRDFTGLTVTAIDAQTGASKWTFDDSHSIAQLIAENGGVYVLSQYDGGSAGNDVMVVALTGSDGSIKWKFDDPGGVVGLMTLG